MTTPRKIVTVIAIVAPISLFFFVAIRPTNVDGPSAATPATKAATAAHEIASLEAARAKNPKHLPILLRLAELKREAGQTQEAIVLLREAIEVEPGNVEAGLELGRCLFEARDAQGAIRTMNLILEKDKNQVDALYNLGAIHGNLGDDTSARQYFTRAAAADPASESARKATAALAQLSKGMQRP